jgi:hypothetical protein
MKGAMRILPMSRCSRLAKPDLLIAVYKSSHFIRVTVNGEQLYE